MNSPVLIADIGGTNARFALETAKGKIEAIAVFNCAEFNTISEVIDSYITRPDVRSLGGAKICKAGIAIANPIHGDIVKMTNHHWEFSIESVQTEFDLQKLLVVNDFKALAMALPSLSPSQKKQIGGGVAIDRSPIALVGAGTGLGVSGLIPTKEGWHALESEGGHASFPPNSQLEIRLLQTIFDQFGHVSCERFLSGAGIKLLYTALCSVRGVPVESIEVPEIMRRGLTSESLLCREALSIFCDMLGTIAGDLAITFGAKGGVYIGGGIVPRLGQFFDDSGFRQRFEKKGRLSDYLKDIPTFVITEPYPAFLGMSALMKSIN
ncbi:glucokinase [Undibacterium sp. MH2W]|uniref:glucokinase n=1 Tax=Undibacterium sp. MH2W TaxID=3413044 RepID=UPI003BF25610